MATPTADSGSKQQQFVQLKSYLMQTDGDGRSMLDLLHNYMFDMLDENTLDVANRPERFAEFSALLKQQQFTYGDAAPPTAATTAIDPKVAAHAGRAHTLFKREAADSTTTVERPTPYTTITTTTLQPKTAPPTPSVVSESKWWRFAGVGLPAREAFHLEQSITKLAMAKGLEQVRFFGKIFGTQGNYLVVTSKRHVDEGEEVFEEVNGMPKPPRKRVTVDMQSEPAYKGCNRYSFWVAPDAVSDWTKLPDVTPQQVNAARRVKKMFTGDLNAAVTACPTFPGTEREYLRAQLSRILSATYVSPANALEAVVPEDEDEEEPEEEEGKPPKAKPAKYYPATTVNKEYAPDEEAGVGALLDLEQWTHSEPYLYETGRQTKVPPKPEVEGEEEPEEEPEDEDEEAKEEEEEEKELFGPLKKDGLFAVISVPKEPNPEDDEEEDEAEPEPEEEEEGKDPNDPDKMEEDEDIPDDEPSKQKVYPWTVKATNTLYKKHSVCVLRSLRWPGAVAYAAQQGKAWGAVYFGDGMKKTDRAFTPMPADPVQKEAADMTEVPDATAANEKLVLRGEDPKEADSEDEKDEEEEEEAADE